MPVVSSIFMGPERQLGACEIYRATMPLSALGQHGDNWTCEWQYWGNLVEQGQRYGMAFWERWILERDLFVFPRWNIPPLEGAGKEIADFISALRSVKKKVVWETDDDYFNDHRNVTEGDAVAFAKHADAATVTTPMLAHKVRQKTGLLGVHVLPNMIDPAAWCSGQVVKNPDWITIGLTGSATHYHDWLPMATVLPKILSEHPNVQVVVAGFEPDYLQGLERTEFLEALRYEMYAHLIQQCDIILAPVDPNDQFNLGKSPIKVIEGMAAKRLLNDRPAGAACIATNNPVYNLAIRHEETGLLVDHSHDGWYEAIDSLIRDEEKRFRVQYAGHAWVLKHHDIHQKWRLWDRAYRSILKQ